MMDKKEDQLKISNLEAEVARLRAENQKLQAIVNEFKNKEQTISSAIIASVEHANKLESSRKKLYSLDIQRSRLMYLRMEQLIHELYIKYPELRKEQKIKDLTARFHSMVYNDINDKNDSSAFDIKKQPLVDDPIKKLLHNIINCLDTKKPDDQVDRFIPTANLSSINPAMMTPSSSGFDLNEALHPTMELDEILQAFNLGKKKENK